MSTQWNPQEPAKMGVKFDALFREFMDTLKSPCQEIDAATLKNFILERISAASRQLLFRRPNISEDKWKSIRRRFKTQFNKYRRTITTFDKNDDGWLADASLKGKRVSCEFWNTRDTINKSYKGTIRRIDANSNVSREARRLKITGCSSYEVEFDDNDIKRYNIFRFKNEYWRVGNGFTGWTKLKFIAPEPEPEPCDDPHQKMCTACYVQCVNVVIIPCGHACLCMRCARRVNICPMCRGPIRRLQVMYYSGVDNTTETDKLKAELKTTRDALSVVAAAAATAAVAAAKTIAQLKTAKK